MYGLFYMIQQLCLKPKPYVVAKRQNFDAYFLPLTKSMYTYVRISLQIAPKYQSTSQSGPLGFIIYPMHNV